MDEKTVSVTVAQARKMLDELARMLRGEQPPPPVERKRIERAYRQLAIVAGADPTPPGCIPDAEDLPAALERSTTFQLIQLEIAYWAGVSDDGRLQDFSYGAIGALSNVLGAMLCGYSPEQYQRMIAARDTPPPV